MATNFFHQQSGRTEYVTPLGLLLALGPFDLDPCAVSEPRPWKTARRHIALPNDGLKARWRGLVWLNPPYGRRYGEHAWVEKIAAHGHGIALLFAKTETRLWHEVIWPRASALLFLSGRLQFCDRHGKQTGGRFTASTLVAFGETAKNRLQACGLAGQLIIHQGNRYAKSRAA